MQWTFTLALGLVALYTLAFGIGEWEYAIPVVIAFSGLAVDVVLSLIRMTRAQNELMSRLAALQDRLDHLMASQSGNRGDDRPPSPMVTGNPATGTRGPGPRLPQTLAASAPPPDDLRNRTPAAVASEDLAAPPEDPITLRQSARPEAMTEQPLADSSFPPPGGLAARLLAAARRWLLGGNTLLRLGMLVLFLGLAFFLSYAAQYVQTPVWVRYAGVMALGLGLAVFGWFLRTRRPAYALGVQGLGIAVLYLSTFAALRLHELVPADTAFVVLVLLTVASAMLAVLQNSRAVALAATLGGFAAPVLTSSGEGSVLALFSYYAILNAGVFAVSWFRAWRSLNLAGFGATFGIGTLWGLTSYTPELFATAEFFLVLFFLQYLTIGFLYARRRLNEQPLPPLPPGASFLEHLRRGAAGGDPVDGALLFGPPLAGFALQWTLVQPFEYGPAASAIALGALYGLLAVAVPRVWRPVPAMLLEICAALGVVFASLAVPLALGATWTSALWGVEAAGVYWVGLRQHRPVARAFALLLLAGALVSHLASLRMVPGAVPVLEGNAFGAVLLAGAFALTSWNLRNSRGVRLMPVETRGVSGAAILALALAALAPLMLWGVGATIVSWAGTGVLAALAARSLPSKPLLYGALALQGLAGLVCLLWLDVLPAPFTGPSAFPAPGVMPCAALFAAALAIAWFARGTHTAPGSGHATGGAPSPASEDTLSPKGLAFLGWGLLWAFLALVVEANGLLPPGWRIHGIVLGYALVMGGLALLAARARWNELGAVSLSALPVAFVLFLCVLGLDAVFLIPVPRPEALAPQVYQPFAFGGWVAWPAVFALNLVLLVRFRAHLPAGLVTGGHVLGAWLLVLVPAFGLRELLMDLPDDASAWRWLGWGLAPTLYLAAVARFGTRLPPFSLNPRAWGVTAAVPVAGALALWFGLAVLFSDGAAAPLPYIPLLNPLEIAAALAATTLLYWLVHLGPTFGVDFAERNRVALVRTTGGAALVFVSCAVFRAVHHLSGIPFELAALAGSMTTQAALSIVWTLVALGLMIGGHLGARRPAWIAGAGLLGLVIAKLFLVDLGGTNSLERIVSFLGVGVMMLVVGYFAPLPPRTSAESDGDDGPRSPDADPSAAQPPPPTEAMPQPPTEAP
ncbi:DUF2339 domain-containing protein [Phaeovibrio sulfidiphilus]|uniref:DUF2339 domain-containing protein n=1 Tax=Phaeovibrio sulfidiphilus TaxID=1220600 RepID=A0A8J7CRN2_9PROT|nr:DUF2339 domain-containing protein [Phaeovibrio sulfidiphilus]MBE1237725.1 DUF2339 domain-containing protein [Phaeovibrio sulfidiphilus]